MRRLKIPFFAKYSTYTTTGSSKLHSEMLRLETKVEVEKLGQDVHTVNKFRSTNGVKSCKLEWNKPLKCWVLPKESVLDPYFHPCLSQQDVFGRLSASYARNPECMMQVWLMQQLRVDPPAASPDPDAWHMQCDRKCKLGSRLARREHSYCSLYSCVTIRSSDGQSPDMLARVLAVLKVKALVSSGEEVETVSNDLPIYIPCIYWPIDFVFVYIFLVPIYCWASGFRFRDKRFYSLPNCQAQKGQR